VTGFRAGAYDRLVVLRWSKPLDADFDRVALVRAPGRASAGKQIYTGTATAYRDRAVRNGVRYRYRIAALDRAGNSSGWNEIRAVPARRLLFSPPQAARLTAPPLLRWIRVKRASYYNVQLYRGARKVLSIWPRQPLLRLRSSWTYRSRPYRLDPGAYRWYVWPGYGLRSQARYGRLLGQSTFVVASP
jgi:hypothetical protein